MSSLWTENISICLFYCDLNSKSIQSQVDSSSSVIQANLPDSMVSFFIIISISAISFLEVCGIIERGKVLALIRFKLNPHLPMCFPYRYPLESLLLSIFEPYFSKPLNCHRIPCLFHLDCQGILKLVLYVNHIVQCQVCVSAQRWVTSYRLNVFSTTLVIYRLYFRTHSCSCLF